MILSLNANAAVDHVIFVDHFTPGETMRTRREVVGVGGKGLCTAQVLAALGAPVQALTFIAGEKGRALEKILAERHIPADLVWVEGETRVIYVIVETDANRHSHISFAGYGVTAEQCEQYLTRVERLAEQAQWALMAGSLPDGAPLDFYRKVIQRLHARGVKVLIDSTGKPARAALGAAPEVLKMNRSEFVETFGTCPQSTGGWQAAYQQLHTDYSVGSLVVTCGVEGILALTPEGAYQARGPALKEVNAAGSGDGASAGLVMRLCEGADWPDALRFAVAAGGAVVLTEGTAECRSEDVTWLLPQAEVTRLEPV